MIVTIVELNEARYCSSFGSGSDLIQLLGQACAGTVIPAQLFLHMYDVEIGIVVPFTEQLTNNSAASSGSTSKLRVTQHQILNKKNSFDEKRSNKKKGGGGPSFN